MPWKKENTVAADTLYVKQQCFIWWKLQQASKVVKKKKVPGIMGLRNVFNLKAVMTPTILLPASYPFQLCTKRWKEKERKRLALIKSSSPFSRLTRRDPISANHSGGRLAQLAVKISSPVNSLTILGDIAQIESNPKDEKLWKSKGLWIMFTSRLSPAH